MLFVTPYSSIGVGRFVKMLATREKRDMLGDLLSSLEQSGSVFIIFLLELAWSDFFLDGFFLKQPSSSGLNDLFIYFYGVKKVLYCLSLERY